MQLVTTALLLAALPLVATAAGTLKVFVLAGQSNMEGHAEVATLDPETGNPKNGTLLYQTTDPRTSAEFGPLRQGDSWTVLDNVKVLNCSLGVCGSVLYLSRWGDRHEVRTRSRV